MGDKKLWVAVDRYGVMRPTRKVPNFPLPPTELRVHAVAPEEGLPELTEEEENSEKIDDSDDEEEVDSMQGSSASQGKAEKKEGITHDAQMCSHNLCTNTHTRVYAR